MTASPIRSRLPVIVGVGQVTDTVSTPETGLSPLELMRAAALAAAQDSGAGPALLRDIDSLTVIRLFADSVPRFQSPFGTLVNAPWSLARRIEARPGDLVYPPVGGDSPQQMLVRACERIAAGESQAALVVGGEALRTELAAKRAGLMLDWGEDAPSAPNTLEPVRSMYSEPETVHGMRSAIAMYALIGQALRAAAGQSVAHYLRDCAELFSGLAAVAKDNPLATRRQGHGADALGTVTSENPFVGFPYTKRMVASAYIDQAAAFLVVSEARADEFGIAQDKRVYLHGAAHAHDQWFVSERERLDRAPAMRLTAARALEQAGIGLQDVAFLDLYSCFPSAVQMACKELGIAPNDPRGLTVTGGLPYFGGPGNNYVTHAIAEMVHRVRGRPGAFGLVLANGGLLTKQAVGLLSTQPLRQPFVCDDADLQPLIDREPKARLAEQPSGEASIESYTVLHGKTGPEAGLVFGRLQATDERFLANTPSDAQTLRLLEQEEALKLRGTVQQRDGRNLFIPQGAAAAGAQAGEANT